jgi:hypothetical protein
MRSQLLPDNDEFLTLGGRIRCRQCKAKSKHSGSTPFSRAVIKRLKTINHALPIDAAFEDCEALYPVPLL